MITLPILILIWVKGFDLDRLRFFDDSFYDTHRFEFEETHDYNTIHIIVCDQKQKAQIPQLNINKYKYDEEEYKYCNVTDLKSTIESKMTPLWNVVPQRARYYHLMQRGFKFLKSSEFVINHFPSIKGALNDYINQIDQLINNIALTKKAAKKLNEENEIFLSEYKNIIAINQTVEEKINELRNYIAFIEQTEALCAEKSKDDNLRFRIDIDNFNLSEKLEKTFTFITDTIKILKQACVTVPNFPEPDPIISETYKTFQTIVQTLKTIESNVNIEIELFKEKLSKHNELKNDLNELSPSSIKAALSILKNYTSKSENLRDKIEEEKKQVELVISDIGAKLIVLPSESQSLLEITIENLKNYLKNFENVRNFTNEEMKLSEHVATQIIEIESKHADIDEKLKNFIQNIELTMDVLKILKDIENKLAFENQYISLEKLTAYTDTPWDYSQDTNLDDIITFVTLHKSTRTQIDTILKEISEHNNNAISFYDNLIDSKQKLEDQFNFHKSKPTPEKNPKDTDKDVVKPDKTNNQNTLSLNEKKISKPDFSSQAAITPKIQMITEEKSVNWTMLSSVIVAMVIIVIAIGSLVFIKSRKTPKKFIQHEN